jgi:hypothetical protein
MRITFLLAALVLLFIQPAFAVVAIPQSKVPTEKPPKVFYSKGKGTMGLIAGLTLGPFGWGGVCLVSHNRTQRAKAKQGCIIWTEVIVTTALIWLVVLAGKSGSSGSGRNSGGGSRGGSRGSGGSKSNNVPDLSNLTIPSGGGQAHKVRKPEEQVLSELPLFLQT